MDALQSGQHKAWKNHTTWLVMLSLDIHNILEENKKESLKEVFQWFYQGILQKIETKRKVKASQVWIAFQVAQKQGRHIILESSNAAERHAEWRKTKVFVDHKCTLFSYVYEKTFVIVYTLYL